MDDIVERLRKSPRGYAEAIALMDEAASEITRLRLERRKLDRRIHNQRLALRENWQIVEQRRKWLGSETARRLYANLLQRYRALQQS